ncbi:uncharacterized protein LOC132304815 [Cornus florida]|uniref:uncharacterized protein LOC132304815 n=1 Tax=Cornus florida TaxID=4283 RepID=UPI00289E9EAD|nr:uncharacterized protein LOC132304815 [Cornus florida]
MSNLTKLEFVTLDISGKNYLSWILDARIHLEAMGLGDTIKEDNEASLQDKANTMIFLRRHINELLLEKTFTTFHASNVLLQQQYRERRFKKYSELISCLLVAEQNNELLLRNHQSRPTGSTPIPETYVALSRGRGRERGRGRGGRNSHNNEYGRGHWQSIKPKHLADLYQALMKEKGKQKEMNFLDHDEPVDTTNLEMNFINHDEPVNITNLDVSNFFDDRDGRIDFLIGDGNVHTS